MTPKQFEAVALSLPGAQLSIQWGAWRIYKVGGKAFAWMDGNAPHTVSFKVSSIAFEMLTKRKGIEPARYRARFNFIELDSLRAMNPREIRQRLAEAHRLIAEKLPKHARPGPRRSRREIAQRARR
jgi:predicted DNA-binding protein (MmcQ/YjbR family)